MSVSKIYFFIVDKEVIYIVLYIVVISFDKYVDILSYLMKESILII